MQQKTQAKKRPFSLLILGVILLACFVYIISAYSPTYSFMLGSFAVSIFIPMIVVFLGMLYCLVTFLSNKAMQGLVITLTLFAYLLLRYFGLTEWIFGLLLLGVFLCVEFALYKRK